MTQAAGSLQAEIVEIARSLASRFAERAALHDRENSFPYENYDNLKAAGYHTLTVPRELGGRGAGILDVCAGQEELGAGDGATALGIGMHLSLLGRLAEAQTWPQDLWEQVCRQVVEEGTLINSAATEPEMGSPSRGGMPRTTAERTADGWVLNGRKTFTTIAPVLDLVVVLAGIPSENKPGSFLVARGTPGLRIEETWDALGMRATGSHDLVLENVHLGDEEYIRPNPQQPDAGPSRAWAALTLGAAYLGVARAARDYAANYARERVPTALGRPIADLEHVQESLGRMDLSLRAARATLHNTARIWDEQPERRGELSPDVAASKYLATNCAIEVTDLAMRLVGGSALSRKLPLERLFRDARAGLYNPPSDETTLKLLGRSVLGERPQLS